MGNVNRLLIVSRGMGIRIIDNDASRRLIREAISALEAAPQPPAG